MQTFSQHIDNILATDRSSLIVIGLLCAIAAYFLKDYLSNPPMIIFVYPLLFVFSVLVQYVFILADAYSPNKLDQWLMWTILAAISGTIMGTGVVALAAILGDRGSTPRARS